MKKLKLSRKTAIIVIAVLLSAAWLISMWICWGSYIKAAMNNKIEKSDLDRLNLEGVNKLMIVAHPDDDTIWGGGHLLEDEYLVVCLTNADNKVRSREFAEIMEAMGQKYLILDYPDKVMGQRSNWEYLKKSLKKDVNILLEYKDWELVVTHNPEGEYGHKHHIATNEIVTDTIENKDILWYFGKYYTKKELDEMKENNSVELPEEINVSLLENKKELLKIYASQAKVVENLSHMLPYENWIKAAE